MRRSSRERSNSARRSKITARAPGGLAGPHHVDVEIRKILRMRSQAVGQRSAALQHAQHVQHDKAEAGPLGEFAGDGQGAIQRHAGIQQRGKLLGEEQDVAPPAARRRRAA